MKSAPRGDDASSIEVSGISAHGVRLLVGDRECLLPFEEFPWFKDAPVGGVLYVERPQPHHLYWPDLDIDLSVDSILNPEQYPLMTRERPSSPLPRPTRAKRQVARSSSRRPRRR